MDGKVVRMLLGDGVKDVVKIGNLLWVWGKKEIDLNLW